MIDDAVIELIAIDYSYQSTKIFDKLNFTLKKGDKVGLMGSNGAGKSTMLRLIMGLIKPDSGRLIVFGSERSREEDFLEVRKQIGFVFQDPDDQLFCSTVAEDIAFGSLNLGASQEEAEAVVLTNLQLFGLMELRDRAIYRLSGGEKRLAALAGVLAMSPGVLLLDEPTAALDQFNTKKLIRILNDIDLTCLIVSHDKDFLQSTCNCIYWLEHGLSIIWYKPSPAHSLP
jgi:cobalt/nickel transport system ATP-binding protein